MENSGKREDAFRTKRKTITIVLFFHIIVLLFLNHGSFSIDKEMRKPLVVKTKIYKPVVQKKVAPRPRVVKRKIVKKAPPRKKKIVKARKTSPKIHRLLDELQMSMSKMDKVEDVKKLSHFTLPSSIERIHVNAEITESTIQKEKIKYQELLIEDLKSHLHLPEYGEVKLKIQLDGRGNILNVTPLLSQSKKNENYLKNTLPRLTFPWFNQYFSEEEQHEFTITFKNES